MSEKVPNVYREELGRVLGMEKFRAQAAEDILNPVRDALTQGAWVSTAADRFAEELTAQETTLASAADLTYEVFTTRHGSEPVEVAERDWRARFSG